jgi:hypothetical protein
LRKPICRTVEVAFTVIQCGEAQCRTPGQPVHLVLTAQAQGINERSPSCIFLSGRPKSRADKQEILGSLVSGTIS